MGEKKESSVEVRLAKYISEQNKRLEGLSRDDKDKILFPGIPRRKKSSLIQSLRQNEEFYSKAVSSGLAKSPTEFWTKVKISGLSPEDWINRNQSKIPLSDPIRSIFEKAGATLEEINSQRITPKKLGNILTKYLEVENVRVFKGEKDLAAAAQVAGATAEEAEALGRKARSGLGMSWPNVPFVGGRGIVVPSKDYLEIVREKTSKGAKSLNQSLEDINRFRMSTGAHETLEQFFQIAGGQGEAVATHKSWKIYRPEMEFAAMLDPESVKAVVARRSEEIPRVIKEVTKWGSSKQKNAALEEMKNLPNIYAGILKDRGYSGQEIDSLVAPIRLSLRAGSEPSPKIVRNTKSTLTRTPSGFNTEPLMSNGRQGPYSFEVFSDDSWKKVNALPLSSNAERIISAGTGKSGKSLISKWTREGRLEKGSNRYIFEQAFGDDSNLKWLGFFSDDEGKQTVLDLTTNAGRDSLKEIELKYAKRFNDKDAIKGLESHFGIKASAPQLGESKKTISATKADVAARKTVEKVIAKKAQGVTEYALPPVLEDYVSKGVRKAEAASKLGSLAKIAPYGAGVAIAADVLSSRDKTGPFWGGVTAGAAFLLTGKMSRTNRLLSAGAGYAGGRLIGGTLSDLHNGPIEGFDETGEASVGRKQLTSFGSGWQGIKKAVSNVKQTYLKLVQHKNRSSISGQNVRSLTKNTDFVEDTSVAYAHLDKGAPAIRGRKKPWIERYFDQISNELAKKGRIAFQDKQDEIKRLGKEAYEKSFKERLPAIQRDEIRYSDFHRSPAKTRAMSFSREEVSKELLDYGVRKNLSKPAKELSNRLRTGASLPDIINSISDNSLMVSHKPTKLESFKKTGITGEMRKINTEGDFGTGWDPARRLAKALFGKVAKEGVREAARGADFRRILQSDEFQEALTRGSVVKELGSGGVGSVDLMETILPNGEKFRYARKQYTAKKLHPNEEINDLMVEAKAMKNLSGEEEGLRALQGSISPTPYGKGKVALSPGAKESNVLYMEAFEDVGGAKDAFKAQGGPTASQRKSLEDAVKELHSKGLYHSDIRPANMLVDSKGRLILIDPMPGRWDQFRSSGKSMITKLGQEQDRMAVEVFMDQFASAGDITRDMNINSNMFYWAIDDIRSGTRTAKGHFSLKQTQEWFRRTGAETVAEQYGIPIPPSSPVAKIKTVGSAKAFSAAKVGQQAGNSPIAAKSNSMKSIDVVFSEVQSASTKDVAAGRGRKRTEMIKNREKLHEKAVVHSARNNITPSRRHTLDQSRGMRW